MKKCTKCLRGAQLGITGVEARNTLRMNMGGAILYVTPGKNGEIEVTLNTENLTDGDYAAAHWDGDRWTWSTGKEMLHD